MLKGANAEGRNGDALLSSTVLGLSVEPLAHNRQRCNVAVPAVRDNRR